VSARDVFNRFDIPRKPNWIRRAVEGFVSRGWAVDTRTFGSDEDWDIYLKAAGFVAAENLSAGLRLPEKLIAQSPGPQPDTGHDGAEQVHDEPLAEISEKFAPAANRLVSLKDNQPDRDKIVEELTTLRSAFASSNAIDPSEKSDVIVSLDAAKNVVEKSDTWFAGAMKYLVFDRVKAAFEGVIEDAIKLIIIGSLAVLATIILALT
jgi:hypothetical protein